MYACMGGGTGCFCCYVAVVPGDGVGVRVGWVDPWRGLGGIGGLLHGRGVWRWYCGSFWVVRCPEKAGWERGFILSKLSIIQTINHTYYKYDGSTAQPLHTSTGTPPTHALTTEKPNVRKQLY